MYDSNNEFNELNQFLYLFVLIGLIRCYSSFGNT